MSRHQLDVSDQERDLILAALRLYQSATVIPSDILEIECNDRDPDDALTPEDIDDLCERINT